MPIVIRGVPLLLRQRERDQRVADRRAQQNAATGGDDEDDGDGGRAARDRSRGADVRRSRRWRGSVAEHLYRKIRPLRIYEGATEVQKLIIGRDLLKARN
jgi:hypothetical protein